VSNNYSNIYIIIDLIQDYNSQIINNENNQDQDVNNEDQYMNTNPDVSHKSDSIIKEMDNDDESEIEITVEQFQQKVELILVRIAEFLITKNININQLFNNKIYHHEISKTVSYEAIPLKDFIMILKQINIKMDMTDIYCIYTKLKYSDDYETIDLKKLINEMNNYGLADKDKPIELEDQDLISSRISLLMKQKGMGFFDVFKTMLNKIEVKLIEGQELKLMELQDFTKFIKETLLINKDNLSKKCLDLIKHGNTTKINLDKLKNLVSEFDLLLLKHALVQGNDEEFEDDIYNDFENNNSN